MRKARRLIHVILTAVGTALILYAVVALQGTYDRILFAALGLVLLEAGVWRLTRSFLPNERKYTALRKETDYFTDLVRRLNRAAVKTEENVESAADELEHVHTEMHHSVDRMKRLAAQEDEE